MTALEAAATILREVGVSGEATAVAGDAAAVASVARLIEEYGREVLADWIAQHTDALAIERRIHHQVEQAFAAAAAAATKVQRELLYRLGLCVATSPATTIERDDHPDGNSVLYRAKVRVVRP